MKLAWIQQWHDWRLMVVFIAVLVGILLMTFFKVKTNGRDNNRGL